ncbi:MAG: magnesium protoporphyrin IX methyltransferase [Gemmatimonadaceae bacterium]
MSGVVRVHALPDKSAHESADYVRRRAWIAEYFDRTAAKAWAQLTTDAPVGSVRQKVRAGRERMRQTLASWLPQDLRGKRIFDAGCGTGMLAIELAERGAEVVAIDLSPTLIDLACARTPRTLREQIDFRSGDMLDSSIGTFDYTVAMDSVIHYRAPEMLAVIEALAARTRQSLLFTIVPSTPMLTMMRAVGRAFPRGSRAPAVEPISESVLRNGLQPLAANGWQLAKTERIHGGFYTSQANMLLRREKIG